MVQKGTADLIFSISDGHHLGFKFLDDLKCYTNHTIVFSHLTLVGKDIHVSCLVQMQHIHIYKIADGIQPFCAHLGVARSFQGVIGFFFLNG